MYLNRDVSAGDQILDGEDDSPVEVPQRFRTFINKALEFARRKCSELKSSENRQQSAVDFWCDAVDLLNRVDRDIQIVSSDDPEREI